MRFFADGISFDKPNQNGRVYDKKSFALALDSFNERRVNTNTAVGELVGRENTATSIDLSNVSHKVTRVSLRQDDKVEVDVAILETPSGNSVLASKTPINVVPRLLGRIREDGKVETARIISFDIVGAS